jgi:hypothetical protein
MGIALGSNFTVNTALPLDDRTTFADLTARDALDALRRYEGLKVYVTSEQKYYSLVGGIANVNWVEDTGGGGGALTPTQALRLSFSTWQKVNFVDYSPLAADKTLRFAQKNGIIMAIAPGVSTNKVLVSRDGVSWSTITLPSSESLSDITPGIQSNDFVILGVTNIFRTTNNGLTWTVAAHSIPSIDSRSRIASNEALIYYAVTRGASATAIYTTQDLVTWTARTTPANHQYATITSVLGGFIATGVDTGGAPVSASSTTGTTWTARTLPAGAEEIQYVAGSVESNVTLGADGNGRIYVNTLGGNWLDYSPTLLGFGPISGTFNSVSPVPGNRALIYGQNAYCGVVVTRAATVNLLQAASLPCTPWNMESSPKCMVASSVRQSGHLTSGLGGVDYSLTAGVHESPLVAVPHSFVNARVIPAALRPRVTSIAYGAGCFIATINGEGHGVHLMRSTDLLSWTPVQTSLLREGFLVFFLGGQFVALTRGWDGTTVYIAYSADGITWSESPTNATTLNGIAFDGTNYIVTGPGGSIVLYGPNLGVALSTFSLGSGNGPVAAIPGAILFRRSPTIAGNNSSGQKSLTLYSSVPSGSVGTPPINDGVEDLMIADLIGVGSTFYAVTVEPRSGKGKCAKSTDGVNWTFFPFPLDASMTGITYANGWFFATNTWRRNLANGLGEIAPFRGQTTESPQRTSGCVLAMSADGETWTPITLPLGVTQTITAARLNDTIIVACEPDYNDPAIPSVITTEIFT